MWTLDASCEVPHWRPIAPPAGLRLAFSTRRGGVSVPPYESMNLGQSTADLPGSVKANRILLLRTLLLSPDRVATAGQVHGVRVAEATQPGHTPECDGLITCVPGLVLAVTTADCMSLLFTAPGAVGVIHSGWRGAADGMPVTALDSICRLAKCGPSAVEVHFGPSARGCCYEVDDEVASRFPEAAVRRLEPKPRLDLPTATSLALLEAGMAPESVHDCGACSMCEPYWYFSHRGDRGNTGRMWAVAAMAD
ncbi:MAG: polyphenol oxidase family protein [Candidatus Eisenbacteria bacterium]